MFSLTYILPSIYQFLGKRKGPELALLIAVLLALGLTFDGSALLININFPAINLAIGKPSFLNIFIFTGVVFALLPFFSACGVNNFYLLGFGLVAASGDTKFILALLVATNVFPKRPIMAFIISLLALIGEFTLAGSLELAGLGKAFFVIMTILFLGLYLSKLKSALSERENILDAASYLLLIINYSSRLNMRGIILLALGLVTLCGLTLHLRAMNRSKFLPYFMGLILILLSSETLAWPYAFACALVFLLAIGENDFEHELKALRMPHAPLLTLAGYYLFILLFLNMVFNFNFALGCFAVACFQLDRLAISSLGSKLLASASSVLPLLSVGLMGGYLYFVVFKLQGPGLGDLFV